MRRILTTAISRDVELDEQDERWPILWLRFGKALHPNRQDPPKSDDTEEEQDEWVEEVVNAFCETHALKDKFTAAASENGGDS